MAVDDVPTNLKVLQGVLTAAGYRLTFATRGQQVLDRLPQVKPDLILLDLMMPEMSGLEVCRALKQNGATAAIPVIFLTASHEHENLVQAFEGGAVDYITKPFNPTELLLRVRTHLELSHLRQQAQLQAAWESLSRQIVQDMHASLCLSEVLNNTVQGMQRLLQAELVMVFRWDEPVGCQPLAVAGSDPAIAHCLQISDCPHRLLPVPPAPPTAVSPVARSPQSPLPELHLPIYQNQVLWGGLVIQQAPSTEPWSPLQVDTLNRIIQQLEISIRHAALHRQLQEANQELERVSNTDSLTQIANRRRFDRRFEQEWQRLQREQQPLALILCDIDYFKKFNDTYGHAAGDACLVAVAQALQHCLKRPADFLARYGGEEFVVILPNTQLAGAIEVVQQMQRAIATLSVTHRHPDAVTLSYGLAALLPAPTTTPATLFAQADQALYRAKATGRDRYAVFSPAPPSG